jgi:four helix bundle protein
MGDFRKLDVWWASHRLVLEIYRCTDTFPSSELFGLTSQMRRAASSIAANLAEGCGRRRDTELVRYARISLGSAAELECHILLARDLGLLDQTRSDALLRDVDSVQRMLARLVRSLPVRPPTGDPRPKTHDP